MYVEERFWKQKDWRSRATTLESFDNLKEKKKNRLRTEVVQKDFYLETVSRTNLFVQADNQAFLWSLNISSYLQI